MDVVVSKSTLRPILFAPWILVVAAGVAVEVLGDLQGLSTRRGILPLLSMSYEGNVPTFYTVILLWLASLLLLLTTLAARKSKKRFSAQWALLAAGFFYIGVDEIFQIHELAGTFVQLSGVLYFSWVIPASILVTGLGLSFIPFLRALPPRTRMRFILAGAIYVGGAVGMELPLGYWTDKHGSHGLGYALIDAVEEALEMLGVNLFVLALVDHLADEGVSLRFAPSPTKPAADAAAP